MESTKSIKYHIMEITVNWHKYESTDHIVSFIEQCMFFLLRSYFQCLRSHRRCSVKKEFLKLSQNSQEKICVGVSFLSLRAANLFKKRLWRRCFPVNFSKFLGTSFSIEHQLLLSQKKRYENHLPISI